MKCASEKWNEAFILNELIFETLEDSCKSIDDIPIILVKNVLKHPDKVREFLDNGYWWTNPCVEDTRPGKSFEFGVDYENYCDSLIDNLADYYEAESITPIQLYANCFNGNMDILSNMSYLPHVDTFPGDFTNHNPRNDVAFNINLTKSDKVKTAFYSFNDKRSVCDFTANDYGDLKTVTKKQKSMITKGKWKESGENEYENYKLEYVADIDYNSMILYPSHYWHNSYIKEDWFIDEDRITLTGFFEPDFGDE